MNILPAKNKKTTPLAQYKAASLIKTFSHIVSLLTDCRPTRIVSAELSTNLPKPCSATPLMSVSADSLPLVPSYSVVH